MDDKLSHMMTLQQEMLTELNSIFGTDIKNFTELESLKKQHMAPDLQKLESLCLFLEREFISCKNSGAYFSACITGAAMIEGFLLMLCWLNKSRVMLLDIYRKHAKTKSFDVALGSLSLETLVEIAEASNWIPPDIVRMELRISLANAYEEVAIARGTDAAEIARGKSGLVSHPAVALFDLMRKIRNLLHAGRWIREGRTLTPGPFEEWCQLGVVLIAEIRDCLIVRFTRDMQDQLSSSIEKYKASVAQLEKALKSRLDNAR